MNKNLIPTHVGFVDQLLGGGTKQSGVYGILTPTGVGKSVLACMIAASGATRGSAFEESLMKPDKGTWILFDFHNGLRLCQERLLSHVARIGRKQVWQQDLGPETDELLSEEVLPRFGGKVVPPEERKQTGVSALSQDFRLVTADLSDPEGVGFMELAIPQCIMGELVRVYNDTPISGVVIDGAPNIWLSVDSSNNVMEWEFLQELVSKFCRSIAKNFNCPVWITHQINGAASSAPPTAPLNHRNAARCKSFADSMDACLVLGTPSEPSADGETESVFAIQCTKGDPKRVSKKKLLLRHDRQLSSIVVAKGYVEDRPNRTWKKLPGDQPILQESDKSHIDELLKRIR